MAGGLWAWPFSVESCIRSRCEWPCACPVIVWWPAGCPKTPHSLIWDKTEVVFELDILPSICLGSALWHNESVIILWSRIGVRCNQNVKASIFEDKLWMMAQDWWSLSLCRTASSLICNRTLGQSHSIFFSWQPSRIYLVSSLSVFRLGVLSAFSASLL